jgi:GTP-binding protein
MRQTAVIIGRPNVGKSTLFNRLVGKRLALVSDVPGVTRDRREGEARLGDLAFNIIDTAGFEDARGDDLAARIQAQTAHALDDADFVMFVTDARAGLLPLDDALAEIVRRSERPVLLIANKCEGQAGAAGLIEAYRLGLGEPLPLSAEHGEGFVDLYDAVRAVIESEDDAASLGTAARDEVVEPEPADAPMQLCVAGRPNVGKSTLINRLIGAERLVTGPEPGITRDAIGLTWMHAGRAVRLIDTAGLRRRARVDDTLEQLSVQDTLRAIRYAQVVALVIDATTGLEKQDLTIARMVADEGRAPLLVANKWDLISDARSALGRLRDRLETSLPQLRGLAILPLSGLTGTGVEQLLPTALRVHDVWSRQLTTPVLNRWLAETTARQPPPMVDGRRLRLRYMTQTKTRPPTFLIFANRPDAVPEAYRRYLANALRDTFALDGIPLRLTFRATRNPYVADRG